MRIKELFERLGQEKFLVKLDEILEGENPLASPDEFSIKEISEAVDSTAFPLITGKLISKKIMDAFTARKKVGDQLVDPFTSKQKVDKIPGGYEEGSMKKVSEGMPYQHTGDIQEKWVQIKGDKYGKILDITEETIMFDQTGLVMRQAKAIGEGAAEFREKHILNTIQDLVGYRAYHPSGVQTALYSSGHGNIITNKLEDHTDLNAAMVKLGLMKRENGDPIDVIGQLVLLVPVALDMIGNALYKNTVLIGGANAQQNPFSKRFPPITSPYLDVNSAAKWYLGAFKKQFVWKNVIPLQVLTKKDANTDAAWERDVVASFKTRYFGECGAVDYRYVIRSSGS